MKETLHQPPPSPHPLSGARPPQGRRVKLGAAAIAFLLVLAVAGLGLLAWTRVLDAPVAGTAENDARTCRNYQVKDQAATPSRSLKEILADRDIIPSHHHPLLGQQAPNFELADSEGKVRNLKQLQDGGPVVLIFFYGFHCVSCLRQLFDVNRDLPIFHEIGARVIAISADPPELTRQRLQQHGPFDFPVLSDPGNKAAQAYGVFKRAQNGNLVDILRHGTFVIDRNGKVGWVNVGDAPFRRNSALLCQLGGNPP